VYLVFDDAFENNADNREYEVSTPLGSLFEPGLALLLRHLNAASRYRPEGKVSRYACISALFIQLIDFQKISSESAIAVALKVPTQIKVSMLASRIDVPHLFNLHNDVRIHYH
jgi:hypothetical protein